MIRNFWNALKSCEVHYSACLQVFQTDLKPLKHLKFMERHLIVVVYLWLEQIHTFWNLRTLWCWSASGSNRFETFETYRIPVKYLIVVVYYWFQQIRLPYSLGNQAVQTASKLLKHIEFICKYLIVLDYYCFEQIRNFQNKSNLCKTVLVPYWFKQIQNFWSTSKSPENT